MNYINTRMSIIPHYNNKKQLGSQSIIQQNTLFGHDCLQTYHKNEFKSQMFNLN